MDSILFGLGAAVFYSLSDIVAKKAVKGKDPRIFVLKLTALGLPLSFLLTAFFQPVFPGQAGFSTVIFLLAAAALGSLGYHLFYRGLEKGRVSVLVPLTGLFALVPVAAGIVVFGEVLTANLALSVLLAIAGTFISSFRLGRRKAQDGGIPELPYAIPAAAAFGITIVFSTLAIRAVGAYWDMAIERTLRVVFLLFAYRGLFNASRPKAPGLKLPRWPGNAIVLVAVLDVLASLSINLALQKGVVSIAVPISATAPALTALLGILYLREKLSLQQKAGIALVLAAIFFASLS